MLFGRRIRGRAEDPPEDGTVARGPLVGARTFGEGALLSLSAALSHRVRPGGLLLYPHQSRRESLEPRLRRTCCFASRSHRKKAVESFFARHTRFQHGDGGLQHGLLLLLKLGHFQITVRSGAFAARSAARRAVAGIEIWV